MGSISKKPKAPTIQYITNPVQTVVAEPTTTVVSEPGNLEVNASEARTESLLRRSRGRFGTIATSFRGFFNTANNDQQRKTLLGE